MMTFHSKNKCTKCGILLDENNRYSAKGNPVYNQCKSCRKKVLSEYAKKRAKLKKDAGKWFFQSGKLGS